MLFKVYLAMWLLSLVIIPQCYAWPIKGPDKDIEQMNNFTNSLPLCIQVTLKERVRHVYVVDEMDPIRFPGLRYPTCAMSYSGRGFAIITLHTHTHPHKCPPLLTVYSHELFHHYDWAVGISSDPLFIKAVKNDFSKLTKRQKKNHYNDYLEDPQEMAAELGALQFIGPSYYNNDNHRDMNLFPKSQAVFRSHLCDQGDKW